MRKYNFECALVMWLQGVNIGRKDWNEQALGCHWEYLEEEDKLANDYIIFEIDEDEFELEHDSNDYEYSQEELKLIEKWDKELDEELNQWKEEELERIKKEFLEEQERLWNKYTQEIIREIYGEDF